MSFLGIYRGMPTTDMSKDGYARTQRHINEWKRSHGEQIVIRTKPLKKPDPADRWGRPREKGIDVMLALDALAMAMRKECDVIVISSTDGDFLPPLEEIAKLRDSTGYPKTEVTAWQNVNQKIEHAGTFVHFVSPDDYPLFHDLRDYQIPTPSWKRTDEMDQPPAPTSGQRGH